MTQEELRIDPAALQCRVAELEERVTRLTQENQLLREFSELSEAKFDTVQLQGAMSVLEGIRDGVLHVNRHTRKIVLANGGMSRLTGYDVAELLELSVDDLHPPEFLPNVLDQFHALLHGTLDVAENVPVLRRDGSIVYCDISPGFTRIGAENLFFCVFRDVTERRRREREVVKERKRFQSLAANAPFGIALIAPDGAILYVNESFRSMFGYDLSEIPDGRTWFRKAFPDSALRHEVIAAWIEGNLGAGAGEQRPRVFEVTCKDGAKKITHFRPVRLETGEHILTCEDITERRRIENALLESQAMFRLLSEQSLMSVALLQDNVYHYVNDAMANLLEYPAEEILSWKPQEFLERVHPEDLEFVTRQAQKKQTGDPSQVLNYQFRAVTKSGRVKWIEIYSKTVRYRGRPANLMTILDITERKRAESELLKAQRLLQAAVEQSPAGILIADAPDVRIRVANAAALGIRGDTALRLTDIPAQFHPSRWQVFHPDGRPFEPEELPLSRAVLYGEVSTNVEATIRHVSGEERRVLANAAPVRNEAGEIVAGVVVFADLTERVKAEEALVERERMLEAILSASPAAITCIQGGLIRWTNPAMVRMFGLESAEEAIGSGVKEYYQSNDEYVRVKRLFRRALSGASSFSHEASFVRKDGRTFTGELRVGPFTAPSGRRGLISAIVDVSERVAAQEALREERENYRRLYEEYKRQYELYRSLLDSSADAVVIYDLEGNVQYVNDSFTRIFGWTLDEVRGQRPQFVPESEKAPSMERIERLIKFGEACCGFETKRFTKDGRLLDISLSASRYHDHEGLPAGMLVALTDISERKNLEAQLRHSAKMEAIGQLAGGVAHDFNNILTAVIGYASLLQRELGAYTLQGQRLGKIIDSAEKAAELTRQLLAFGRKQMLDMKILSLNNVIAEIYDLLKRLIGEEAQLSVVTDPDAGFVRADEIQVQQILMNLIINARDAINPRGKITIETSSVTLDDTYVASHPEAVAGDYVVLEVSDDGAGMTPEVASRIFEPFFTTKEKGVGTGLGLSTVFGIVKQHGGHVSVYSEPGQGATFKVYFPRVSQAEDRTLCPKQPDTDAQPKGAETILLVEDEDVVRQLAAEALTMLGYRILAAADPEEALRLAEHYPAPIHMILTDVVLPGMDGKTLVGLVTKRRKGIRTLFVSGYTENFIVRRGVLDQDVNFLHKPFSLEALGRKVREVLDAP
jgi:PAS domain S-box-containing protein